jgi:hypothetical protein
MKPWTITVDYHACSEDGKPFRARSVVHVEAENAGEAYAQAAAMLPQVKLGAILPGKHSVAA